MIQFKEVEKYIDDQFKLGPINFKVEPSTVTALIGNNGAGKSTFIRLLTGMVFPDGGSINRFDEKEIDTKWKEKMAYVPQTSIGFERFTLKQLTHLYKIGYETWDEDEFMRLTLRFQLPMTKRFDSLSVGMQKLALLMLALSRNSKVLVMDEPLSGVDMESQEMMRDEWVSYLEADSGRSIIFASHVPEEVKEFADYIVCMNQGQLTGSYEKDQLKQNYGRIWAHGDAKKVRNFSEVVNVHHDERLCEITTRDMEKTVNSIRNEDYEIVMQKGLDFSEILRLLVKEQGGERNNDIRN
ncbi:hypothetical protein CR194_05800 [Salipaludibacillus keqinensis]|uniref:ABC transporter domain-containing protein n=1 Tax=Salipaludibacillus keqinensis TaxID=2045207 RepID=A0A323TLP4_9BACI|nr:ABC transporter ATP-binding protein [Salipaludibacillus keqinensis]PYZ95026.1 hypothetical protein CR194_05800 [Salipaludibacillus keqinensis]